MKKAQQEKLMNKIISDKKLTTGHIKTLMYFITHEHENINVFDIVEILNCSQQYVSKIFQDLKKYGYIKVVGKIEHTRMLVWNLDLNVLNSNNERE